MAENKKSFVLYSDQRSIIDMLPNELAGQLFKHIYSYVNDENPINDNPMINLAFEPIKLQLKRDLIKWSDTKEGRSKAGKASAEARRNKNEQELTNLTNVDFVQQTLTNSTVNDNVNVNVNVINKDIDFKNPSLEDCIKLFISKTENNWTEHYATKSANIFYNFYESKNWMVGKNKMKSLNGAIGGWISRDDKPELNTTKSMEQIIQEKKAYFKTQGFQI